MNQTAGLAGSKQLLLLKLSAYFHESKNRRTRGDYYPDCCSLRALLEHSQIQQTAA